jgi:hypothetical protein
MSGGMNGATQVGQGFSFDNLLKNLQNGNAMKTYGAMQPAQPMQSQPGTQNQMDSYLKMILNARAPQGFGQRFQAPQYQSGASNAANQATMQGQPSPYLDPYDVSGENRG